MRPPHALLVSLALVSLVACRGGGGTPADLRADPSDLGQPVGPSDLGPAFPTPLRHVVVIVKENHSFDSYFGAFPGAEGTSTCPLPGGVGPCPKAPDRPRDLCHTHDCALTAWNGGAMDGWASVAGSTQSGDDLAWAQYNEAGVPGYWAYAKAFTLADHFFANELGPSFPGHLFLIAAQAGWALEEPPINPLQPVWGCTELPTDTVPVLTAGTCATKTVLPCFDIPSIPTVLPPGISWRFYGTNYVLFKDTWSMFNAIAPIRNGPGWANVVTLDRFVSDVRGGTLPNVVWLVPQDLTDEHPGINGVCMGENQTIAAVNEVMLTSGSAHDYWKDTAILITTDDYGGWYDHVAPPRQYGCDAQHPYGLGFRLPLIVVSPYARPHFVYKDVAEQASIPRFIEKVFGAPALSTIDPAAQDGQANDLLGAFDFSQAPNPPLMLNQRFCL
jgi:phospholipase C